MKQESKVLACVDPSPFADAVTDCAAWAALRMQAPLELLHVIVKHAEVSHSSDRSGAIGLDAQERLLDALSQEDEARSKLARTQGREFLSRLRQRAVALGVDKPDMRLRYGDLQESLSEREADVDWFVLGRRGESAAHTPRDLGRQVERVVRQLKKPVFAVTEHFKAPQRVLLAFDGGAVTRRGVEMLARQPLFQGLELHVLMSGTESRDAHKQLEWARATLAAAGVAAQVGLQPGDAEREIAQAVSDRGIDLLVMGAYSHSPLRSLLLGSRTSDVLRAARVPSLLLR